MEKLDCDLDKEGVKFRSLTCEDRGDPGVSGVRGKLLPMAAIVEGSQSQRIHSAFNPRLADLPHHLASHPLPPSGAFLPPKSLQTPGHAPAFGTVLALVSSLS